jgi:DNA-binding XRE family transcriptional regulator
MCSPLRFHIRIVHSPERMHNFSPRVPFSRTTVTGVASLGRKLDQYPIGRNTCCPPFVECTTATFADMSFEDERFALTAFVASAIRHSVHKRPECLASDSLLLIFCRPIVYINEPWDLTTEDKIVRDVAVRIRKLRAARGWSQERLAEEAGIHRTYLGGIETARRNPSLRNLIRIALALQVRMAQLFEEGR